MGFLFMLLVAMIVGFLADAIVPGRLPGGWLGAMVAGLVGSALGGFVFGELGLATGPELGGLALIPSLIGAILVVLAWSFFVTHRRRTG